jgi:hypothetical protein
MHKEFPRVFGRIPFVNVSSKEEEIELTLGIGRYAVLTCFGRWFFKIGLV